MKNNYNLLSAKIKNNGNTKEYLQIIAAINKAEITGDIPQIAGPILCYISKEKLQEKPDNDKLYRKLRSRYSYISLPGGTVLKNRWTIEEVKHHLENGHTIQIGEFRDPDVESGESITFKGSQFKRANMIAIDIDNEKPTLEKILKESHPFMPAMIYQTLSYTPENPRYRVIYLLDRTVNEFEYKAITGYFIKKVSGADTACKDLARMYLGGKAVPYFEGNFIFVDELMKIPEIRENKAKLMFEPEKRVKSDRNGIEIKELIEVTEQQFCERLRKIGGKIGVKQVERLRAYDFINGLPMDELLGINVGDSFRCIMPDHIDNNPSASIIEVGEKQMYKCFGCNDGRALNLFDVIRIIIGKTQKETSKYVLNNLNVEYDTAFRWEALETIQFNRIFLSQNQDTLIYKKLNDARLLGTYIALTIYFENYLPEIPVENERKISMFASMSRLSKTFKDWDIKGSDTSSISRKTRDLSAYGLIEKVDYKDLTEDMRRKSESMKAKGGRKYGITYWRLPELNDDILDRALERMNKEKSFGYTKRHLNRVQMFRTHGKEETHKVYNQDILVYSDNIDSHLMDNAKAFLKIQGYFTRQEIIAHSKYNEKKVYQYLPGVAKELGLVSKRINKEIKEKFDLDLPKGSMVYIPKDYQNHKFGMSDSSSIDDFEDDFFGEDYLIPFKLQKYTGETSNKRIKDIEVSELDDSDIPF